MRVVTVALVLLTSVASAQTGFVQSPGLPRTTCAIGTDELSFQRLTMVDPAVPGPGSVVTFVVHNGRPVAMIKWGANGEFVEAILLTAGLEVRDEDTFNEYLKGVAERLARDRWDSMP